jgi:hypothetical protein
MLNNVQCLRLIYFTSIMLDTAECEVLHTEYFT